MIWCVREMLYSQRYLNKLQCFLNVYGGSFSPGWLFLIWPYRDSGFLYNLSQKWHLYFCTFLCILLRCVDRSAEYLNHCPHSVHSNVIRPVWEFSCSCEFNQMKKKIVSQFDYDVSELAKVLYLHFDFRPESLAAHWASVRTHLIVVVLRIHVLAKGTLGYFFTTNITFDECFVKFQDVYSPHVIVHAVLAPRPLK